MKLAGKRSGVVALVLVVVIVAALGLIAWRMYVANSPQAANQEAAATRRQDLMPDVQEINSPEDFSKVEKTLNDADLSNDGASELGQQLKF